MEHANVDLLITELYLGRPCAQRYYLRNVLHFLVDHPQYLQGTAADLCKAMRGLYPSFRGEPVRWQHTYTVLRRCDLSLTERGIVPGGTMPMLRALMARVTASSAHPSAILPDIPQD